MDDRQAHFIGLIGDICSAAELGSLRVEVVTGAGARAAGVPGRVRAAQGEAQADESGYARTVRVDDRIVALEDVVECTVRAPAGTGS